jgi:hypothetical protein
MTKQNTEDVLVVLLIFSLIMVGRAVFLCFEHGPQLPAQG